MDLEKVAAWVAIPVVFASLGLHASARSRRSLLRAEGFEGQPSIRLGQAFPWRSAEIHMCQAVARIFVALAWLLFIVANEV